MIDADSIDGRTVRVTFAREFLSLRINRFLLLHALLMLGIGALALLAPPGSAGGGAWWIFNGVAYVGSLSALLLGLSSAQAETDEFPILFTHPVTLGGWVGGKLLAMLVVTAGCAMLLGLPVVLGGGANGLLLGAVLASAGVGVVWSWFGLAIGLQVEDPVRGLIVALLLWLVLLFGLDLLLIVAGGSAWVRAHPLPWVGAMMLSPLDAYRVMVLFAIEQATFSAGDLHPLTRWWLAHPVGWLVACLGGWASTAAILALAGARRRRERA